jgi:hypothetical protein
VIEAGAVAVVAVVLAVLRGGRGSPGMRWQGLLLVREGDDAPAGTARALWRSVVFGITALVVVGPFSPLFDRDRRGWHDRASGTRVVGRPPDDAVARTDASSATDGKAAVRRPVPPPPLPASVLDDAEHGTPAVAPTKLAPPEPPPARVSGDADRPGFALLVGDGRFPLGRRTLVGRDPAADAREDDHVETLRIEDRSLSKTHALVEVEGTELYVTDRWSLNGTTVVLADGRRKLPPGERVRVPEGASLRFGAAEARIRRSPAP